MANIRRTSAVDEVFHLIQGKIHSGEFPIGYCFAPQKRMAEEYGVSVSTIREAVGKLTMLGYLSAKQGVGTRVESVAPVGSSLGQYAFLTSRNVIHFVEARLCLEKSAIRLAAYKAKEADFAVLGEVIEQQKLAVAQNDSSRFTHFDKAFHMGLLTIGQNPILIQLMEGIQEGLFDFIEETTRLESVKYSAIGYHERILACVKERDVLMAEKTLVEHLWDAIRLTEATLGSNMGLDSLFEREARLHDSFGLSMRK